jgi:hypothetical protein
MSLPTKNAPEPKATPASSDRNVESKGLIEERDHLMHMLDTLIGERATFVNEQNRLMILRDELIFERNKIMEERNTLLTRLDEMARDRNALMFERDATIAMRDAALRERDLVVDVRDAAMVARDAAMRERDVAVAARDAAMGVRDAAMRERDVAIAARDAAMRVRDAAMRDRDEALNARDCAMTGRDAAMHKRNELFASFSNATALLRQADETSNALFAEQTRIRAELDAAKRATARASPTLWPSAAVGATCRERDIVVYGDEGNSNLLRILRQVPDLNVRHFNQPSDLVGISVDTVAICTDEPSAYLAIACEIRKACAPHHPAIRHSLQLIESIPYDVRDMAFVFGFPGAGNVLCNRLLTALHATTGAPFPCPALNTDLVYAAFSAHYNLLTMSTSTLVDDLQLQRPAYFNFRSRGGCDLVLQRSANEFSLIRNIDSFLHLNTQVHSTHELPSNADISAYVRLGFTPYMMIRNPLDILISIIRKINPSTFGNLPEKDRPFNPEEKRPVNSLGDLVVWSGTQHLQTFRFLCQLVATYFERSLPLLQCTQVVRYEDAMTDPEQCVEFLARSISADLNTQQRGQIAGIIGKKSLGAVESGHYYRPGSGKWREFLDARHYSILQDTGVLDLMNDFGYAVPDPKEFSSRRDNFQGVAWSNLARHSDVLFADAQRRIYLGMCQTYSHDACAEVVGCDLDIHRRRFKHLDVVATSQCFLAEIYELLRTNRGGLTDALVSYRRRVDR